MCFDDFFYKTPFLSDREIIAIKIPTHFRLEIDCKYSRKTFINRILRNHLYQLSIVKKRKATQSL